MTQPPRRHKGNYDDWIAHLGEEATAREIEAVIRTRAEKVVDIWNARSQMLFYPTFATALHSDHRWLTFLCPACRQVGEIDLAQFDYHPDASISALIPKLSCTRCCPNPPHARLLRLHRAPTMASIARPWRR